MEKSKCSKPPIRLPWCLKAGKHNNAPSWLALGNPIAPQTSMAYSRFPGKLVQSPAECHNSSNQGFLQPSMRPLNILLPKNGSNHYIRIADKVTCSFSCRAQIRVTRSSPIHNEGFAHPSARPRRSTTHSRAIEIPVYPLSYRVIKKCRLFHRQLLFNIAMENHHF